jgi:hypothetical protein
MGEKTTGEHQGWAMMPFIQGRFPRAVSENRVLFEAEWRAVTREAIQRR